MRQELSFARETIQRITANLASEDNVADNTNYFYNMEEPSKAHVESFRPFNTLPPETGVPYKRIPFGLKVSGTFTQVASFIHAVETGPRLSAITYFSFRKQAGTSLVTVDFNVDLLGTR